MVRVKSMAATTTRSLRWVWLGLTSTVILPRLTSMVPLRRRAGRLDFELTTLGLGGQAGLQWPLPGEDPVRVVLKAHALGVNFFDTSNVYGPSQSTYGRAFRELGLVPGLPGYRESLRRAVFLSSKTMLRFARGGWRREGLVNRTDGPRTSTAVLDLRRTLSQVFGDGRGWYPLGSYLDLFLVHAVGSAADVYAAYVGYDHPDPRDEHVGVLAALRDFRDGTNTRGATPGGEARAPRRVLGSLLTLGDVERDPEGPPGVARRRDGPGERQRPTVREHAGQRRAGGRRPGHGRRRDEGLRGGRHVRRAGRLDLGAGGRRAGGGRLPPA